MANTTFTGPVRSQGNFELGVGFSPGVVGDFMPDVELADVQITTAQVLALNATPITVVAAPGAGKILQFLGAAWFLDHAGTDYVAGAGEDFVIRYTNGSGKIVSTAVDGTLIAAAADTTVFMTPVGVDPETAADVANAALVGHILTGEVATGDSPFNLRILYRTWTVSQLEGIS